MNDILYIFHSGNHFIEFSLVLDLSAGVRSENFVIIFITGGETGSLLNYVAWFLLREEYPVPLQTMLHGYVFFSDLQ